jgi:hypothetical protein
MMNDNMKLVLKALRSGEYKQTTEALQDENGYCCLGVMCAVYGGETGVELEPNHCGEIYGSNLADQAGVQEWVGLKSIYGESRYNDSLTDMNDGGKTFSQIADFIESEPEGLLV